MDNNRIYVFTKFERLWHWFQAMVVSLLLLSGFALHGSLGGLISFSLAHKMHNILLWLWIGSYIFLLFWLIVTGEIKQYRPVFKNMNKMVKYYSHGIFKGERHPHRVVSHNKHNPLQAIAYDVILFILIPIQMVSGLFYLYYNQFGFSHQSLTIIAIIHTLGAFAFLAFLIMHFYLATSGPTPLAYFKTMTTGYNDHADH